MSWFSYGVVQILVPGAVLLHGRSPPHFSQRCPFVSYLGGCPRGSRRSYPELLAPRFAFIRTPIDNTPRAQPNAVTRRASRSSSACQPHTSSLYPPLPPPPMVQTSFTSAFQFARFGIPLESNCYLPDEVSGTTSDLR